jgi:hypothetical protein
MRLNGFAALPALIFIGASSLVWAQGGYALPFENYRRSHDGAKLTEELRDLGGINFSEDIPYLIGLISNDPDDDLVGEARVRLFTISSGLIGTNYAKIREAFTGASAAFERRLAVAPVASAPNWEFSIASLSAYVGLQPTPQARALLLRMLTSKNEGAAKLAMLGLARTRPLAPEAKAMLIEDAGWEKRAWRLVACAFNLDDADVLKAFLTYLENDDVQEQQQASKILADSGPMARPALDSLLRLQKRPGLDPNVSRNIEKAIEAINR